MPTNVRLCVVVKLIAIPRQRKGVMGGITSPETLSPRAVRPPAGLEHAEISKILE